MNVEATLPHRLYHNTLKPGISIGGFKEKRESACTLGVMFKTESEPDKKFILTVKHGVGSKGEPVVQPGTGDKGTWGNRCARVSQFYYYGGYSFDKRSYLLDYAFCEIDSRKEELDNTPLHTNIAIINTRDHVDNGNNDECNVVQKVGRETAHTYGYTTGKFRRVTTGDIKEVYAIIISGFNETRFGKKGDSGAPVFDENGLLWGILQGTCTSESNIAIIVPIYLILKHAKEKFKVEFTLIKK